jgi:murein DD-endopeptidase MepM/ murein hydrolase activator NlpD
MAKLKKKPKPPPSPPVSPPVSPPPVTTPAKLGSYGNASIDQWDAAFIAAVAAVERKRGVRVNPHFMKAMMDVETGGDGSYPADRCRPCDGTDCVPACGPMQIKRRYHFHRCPECDFATVPGQIELATHIIGMTMLERGRDEYDALVTTYFPQGDINGTTQKMYVDRVRELVRIMEGGKPAPKPKPKQVTEQDILNLISSNAPGVYISFPFRGIGSAIYAYGKGHGTTGNNQHSGIDIWMPDETPVNCVFGGEVICVGNAGRPMWGNGCGYFNDDNGGIGKIEVLTTDRTIDYGGKRRPFKITYGHMSSSVVRVGQVIGAGQRIGRSGIGGGWPHVHLDFNINAPNLNNPQIWNNGGEYHLIDPMPAILSVLGAAPLPASYPDAYEVAQPSELTTFVTVRVTADSVPVLQRAHRDAVKVAPDIPKGDTFEAAQLQLGDDGNWYWIGRYLRGRVPIEGTIAEDGPRWEAA